MPDGWRGEVIDLSAVGMRVRSLVLLAPMTVVDGALLLEDGCRIPLQAEVVWSRPPDHTTYVPAEMGLELLAPSEMYLRALAELFAEGV